jgi:hypothetical protein
MPKEYQIMRLYDMYEKETAVFPSEEQVSSFIDTQPHYNSFIAESGLIGYEYLRTLFITQTINRHGYYEYFVKRNG